MREIKFRGYDGMEWIYGSAVQFDKYTKTWYMIENGAPDDDWVMVGGVGQFIGLKDRDGKEICEGDVIKWDEKEWGNPFKEIVKWDYELFSMRKNDWNNFGEIIGNIYENPELVE